MGGNQKEQTATENIKFGSQEISVNETLEDIVKKMEDGIEGEYNAIVDEIKELVSLFPEKKAKKFVELLGHEDDGKSGFTGSVNNLLEEIKVISNEENKKDDEKVDLLLGIAKKIEAEIKKVHKQIDGIKSLQEDNIGKSGNEKEDAAASVDVENDTLDTMPEDEGEEELEKGVAHALLTQAEISTLLEENENNERPDESIDVAKEESGGRIEQDKDNNVEVSVSEPKSYKNISDVIGLSKTYKYDSEGNITNEQDFARDAAKITLSKIRRFEDLNAKTEQEGDEKFKEKTKKLWKDLVVHGIFGYKDNKPSLLNYTDLDGDTSLGLLKKAGINTKRITYIKPGDQIDGFINIDTGNQHGLVLLEKDGQVTAYLDHHSDESNNGTSATEITYNTLVELGLLERNEVLDKAIEFVTMMDNKTFPEAEKYFNDSHRNLIGLHRFIKFDSLIQFFEDGKNPTDELSEDELKKYGFVNEKRNRSDELKEKIDKSFEVLERLEQEGFVLESKKLGKVVVDIGGGIPAGFDAVVAKGYDVYLNWGKNGDGFFISSKKDFPENFNLNDGKKIRNTMWIKPRLEAKPSSTNISDVLREMLGSEFKFEGLLGDLIKKSDEYEKDISLGFDNILEKYTDLEKRKEILELYLKKVDDKTEEGMLEQSEILIELQKIEDKIQIDVLKKKINHKLLNLPDEKIKEYSSEVKNILSKAENGLKSYTWASEQLTLIFDNINKEIEGESVLPQKEVEQPISDLETLEKIRYELLKKTDNGKKLSDEDKHDLIEINKKINALREQEYKNKIEKEKISKLRSEFDGIMDKYKDEPKIREVLLFELLKKINQEASQDELELRGEIVDAHDRAIKESEGSESIGKDLHEPLAEGLAKDWESAMGMGKDSVDEVKIRDVFGELGMTLKTEDIKSEMDCIVSAEVVKLKEESRIEIEKILDKMKIQFSEEDRKVLIGDMEETLNAALDAEARQEFSKLKYHKKVLAAGVGVGAIAAFVSSGARMLGSGILMKAGLIAGGGLTGAGAGYIRAKTREWFNPTIQKIKQENKKKLEEIRQDKKAQILKSENIKLVAVQKIKEAVVNKYSGEVKQDSDYASRINSFLDSNEGNWNSLEENEKEELVKALSVLAEVTDENNSRMAEASEAHIDGRWTSTKKSMVIGATIGAASSLVQTFAESPYAPAIVSGAIGGIAMSGAIEARMAERANRKKEKEIIDRIYNAENESNFIESEELKSYLESGMLNKYPVAKEKAKNILMDRLLAVPIELNKQRIEQLKDSVRESFERTKWQKASSYAIGIGAGIATGMAGKMLFEHFFDGHHENAKVEQPSKEFSESNKKTMEALDNLPKEDKEYIAQHGLEDYLNKKAVDDMQFKGEEPAEVSAEESNILDTDDGNQTDEEFVSKEQKEAALGKAHDLNENLKKESVAKREQLIRATIGEGDGIIHALARQLEDEPEKFGYSNDSGLDKHTWAWRKANNLAANSGYIDSNSGHDIRVGSSGIGKAAYLVELNKQGKLEVHEYLKDQNGVYEHIESHSEVDVVKSGNFEGKEHESYEYQSEDPQTEHSTISGKKVIGEVDGGENHKPSIEESNGEDVASSERTREGGVIEQRFPSSFGPKELEMLGIDFNDENGATDEEITIFNWAEAENEKVALFLEDMRKKGIEKPLDNFGAVSDIKNIDKQLALLELFKRQDNTAISKLFENTEIFKHNKFASVTSFNDEDGNLVLNYNGKGWFNKIIGSRDFQTIIHKDGKVFVNGPALWNKDFDSTKNIKEVLEWPLEALKRMNEGGKNPKDEFPM